MKHLKVVLCLLLAVGFMAKAGTVKAEEAVIAEGKEVSFEYTLSVDGEVVDSSEGREPMVYTHGQNTIIPGLSRALEGMSVGEEKEVVIAPEDAYGMVDPNALQEVPTSSLPQDVELQVGMVLQVSGPEGQAFPVRVVEIKDENVVIDFNHPLAGKTLNFKVKIVSVN